MSNSETSNQTPPALQVTGLRAGYDGRVVLDGIDFSVEPGEIRIILGGSGCGKSTLLNNIIGIEKPLAGTVSFHGQSLRAGIDPIPPLLRQEMGVLFQTGALLSSYTVAENVALPIMIHRPNIPRAIVDELVAQKLQSVQMLHAWHRLPSELSGGMRKRAALARALALDPRLLFCDEPSAGLDPVTSRSLDDLLLSLNAELHLSIVIVTHELESIRALNGKVLFLSGGKVLLDASLHDAEQSTDAEVIRFFGRTNDTTSNAKARLNFCWEE